MQVERSADEDVIEDTGGVLDVEGAVLVEEVANRFLVEDGRGEVLAEDADEGIVGKLSARRGGRAPEFVPYPRKWL